MTPLVTWGALTYLSFAALFWSLTASRINSTSVANALDLAGSSMLTLGFDAPSGLLRRLAAFAAAGVGLTLFALVITYLPTLYGAFSRRERLVTKLSVRTGIPSSGPALLFRTWELERFGRARGGVGPLGGLVHRRRRIAHLVPPSWAFPVSARS